MDNLVCILNNRAHRQISQDPGIQTFSADPTIHLINHLVSGMYPQLLKKYSYSFQNLYQESKRDPKKRTDKG